MLTLADILRTIATPAIVAAVIMLAFSGGKGRRFAPLAWALAMSVGYTVGHVAGMRLSFADIWLPKIAHNWLIWLAAAAAILGVAAHMLRRQLWLPWVAWLLIAAAAPPLLMQSFIEHHWSNTQAAVHLGIMSGGMLLVIAMFSRRSDAAAPALWVLLAMATAVTLLMSASQKYGQLGLSLSAALAAAVIIAWRAKLLLSARAAGPVVAVISTGLLILSHSYAKLTTTNALLLLAAACCTADVPLTPGRWGRGWRIAARIAAVTILAGLAAALATRGFLADQAEVYEY